MAMKLFGAIMLAAATLAVAACGGDDDDESAAAPDPTSSAQSGAGGDNGGRGANRDEGNQGAREGGADGGPDAGRMTGVTIKVAESDYGPILFDASDQAIYLFDKEEASRSECYGACAEAWPPVLTEGDPQAAAGAESDLFGTTERDDGSTQVTYGGHPLYYYAHEGAGQVLCHNVEEFGGLWLVVTPEGQAVS